MKKFLFILATALPMMAAEQIQLYISIDATPVTGDTLTINGATRTWTNAHSANTILTNLAPIVINHSTTNLYFNLGAFQHADRPIVLYNDTNELRLIFSTGTAVTASEAGSWASFTYVTNPIPTTYSVRVPYSVEAATNQTNIASALLDYIEDKATNSFVGGSTAMTNVAFLAAANVFTGTNSMIQSFLNQPTLTNVLQYTGIMDWMTNGVWTNGFILNGTATNLTVYGGLSAPGAGSNSERYGNATSADGANAVAIGRGASADVPNAFAGGDSAGAGGTNSVALGTAAETGTFALDSVALGTGASVNATNGLGLGSFTTINVNHANSVAIGNYVTTTQTNQIMIGRATHHTTIPGRLEVTGTISNSVFTATNVFGVTGGPYASLHYRRNNITTVAAGANLIDLGGATYCKLSGPGGAFSLDKIDGGTDGYYVVLTYAGGETWTIANESGSGGGGAEDRILTGTGADFSMTNNPATCTLIYDSEASRWNVLTHSN